MGLNLSFAFSRRQPPTAERIIGHGSHRYAIDKEWGNQHPHRIPVKNCHEMVQDSKGRLILLTDHVKNNVIIYNADGKVLQTWTQNWIGAHGLTLAKENDEEFLFITDSEQNQVYKCTMDGQILMTLNAPFDTGLYQEKTEYKPTEVAVAPNGDFYVADGYGKDYILHYNHKGELIRTFGGKGDGEAQLQNAHGVTLDTRDPQNLSLLVTSRAKQEFKRFSLDGKHLETIKTPGCWICRPVIHGKNLYFAVIVSKDWWTYDGFVMVMDKNNKVVSLPGASAPGFSEGVLTEPDYDGLSFLNPHDVCVDQDENLYVPQWYSGKTYPVKLTRI